MIRTLTLEFRIVAVTDKPNSFGLHGHVMINRAGEAWEVGRSRGPWNNPQWNKGDDIKVPASEDDHKRVTLHWERLSCEIPRRLPPPPDSVIRSVFK